MSKVKYKKTSQYKDSVQTQNFLKYYVHRRIPPANDDYEYTVPSEHHQRPDNAADDIFGNSRLWWVFMVKNMDKLIDPVEDFKEGLVLTVPTIVTLQKSLT